MKINSLKQAGAWWNKMRLKRTLVCLALAASGLALLGSCQHSMAVETPLTARDSAMAPRISFKQTEYHFGQVKSGALVNYNFVFKNTGKSPLIIADIATSCGCTVPHYDHIPVPEGGLGHIQVVFNTAGKAGIQEKIITITANTIPRHNQVALVGIVNNIK